MPINNSENCMLPKSAALEKIEWKQTQTLKQTNRTEGIPLHLAPYGEQQPNYPHSLLSGVYLA